MIVSFIVAAGLNNEIGRDNDLPWKMPDDMKFFKQTTMGHCVLMGRSTYESGPGPLKNRTNIVITTKKDYHPEGTVVFNTIEEGIEYARSQGETELFIIGGGEIFKQTLHLADRIYLTRIYHTFDATVFFPELSMDEWKLVKEEKRHKDDRHAYDFTFFVYERK
ncbi:MAG TPA: dihydrofolate reductase [Bacteroidia bacterium]|nr:dihydrofolate reductase [Bacteroidia bacterium]